METIQFIRSMIDRWLELQTDRSLKLYGMNMAAMFHHPRFLDVLQPDDRETVFLMTVFGELRVKEMLTDEEFERMSEIVHRMLGDRPE